MTIQDWLFIGILVWLLWWLRYHHEHCSLPPEPPLQPRRSWRLRPRSPKDCPLCQAQQPHTHSPEAIVPWSHIKSKRGRPQSISSDGHACPCKHCYYFGITDETIHALVAHAIEGQAEPIRRWRCQACDTTFSERRNTAMRWLKTPAWRVQEVVTALGEGVDQAAAVRIFNHHPTTIARWLRRAGQLDQPLHDHFFSHFRAQYIQLDELKTKTRRMGETWVWVALDVSTRVMIALHIGPRNQKSAHQLLHEVKQRLAEDNIPVFSSDGLRMYFYAITAHYGLWEPPAPSKRAWQWVVDERVLFAQLHKIKTGYKLTDLRSFIRLGSRLTYRETLTALGFTGKVETAYVERINLTLRHLIAPLSRRTWSLAHDEYTLGLHIGWGRAYYHFARTHHSLRRTDSRGRYRHRTPAMAARVVHKRLTVASLMLMPLPGLRDMP